MSKIEWTGQTWNPITGCSRISDGCKHCYAERMTKRLAAMGQVKYQGLLDDNGRFNGTLRFGETALEIPLKRKKPTVWFVNSMSDLFHDGVQVAWLSLIWQIMAKTPQHTYQILTKRACNMASQVDALSTIFGVLPNVWLGVSVEDQRAADERIPYLLQTPAAVRFLSCEPLLGPVKLIYAIKEPWKPRNYLEYNQRVAGSRDETTYCRIDWVIAGGESGPGARPMHPDWVRSLRDQCQGANVPFFFKQWGEYGSIPPKKWVKNVVVKLIAGSPEWQDTRMFKVGKKNAGRLLDGRTWDEIPEVNRG